MGLGADSPCEDAVGFRLNPKDRRRRIYDPPTPEQLALFARWKHLVLTNGNAVGWWKAKLAGIEVADLRQAGLMGLWRATLKFDPSRGLKFATIARHAIRWAMQDAIEDARYGRRVRKNHLAFDHSKFTQLPFEEDESPEE